MPHRPGSLRKFIERVKRDAEVKIQDLKGQLGSAAIRASQRLENLEEL